MSSGSRRSAHRANYTLERGIWHATCRYCGHRVSDSDRRRAAAVYREHIRETNTQALGVSVSVELVEEPGDVRVTAELAGLPEPLVG